MPADKVIQTQAVTYVRWKVKDPNAHSESEETRFNKGCAGIIIKMQTEVRMTRSQALGRFKSRVGENTNQSQYREVRNAYNK